MLPWKLWILATRLCGNGPTVGAKVPATAPRQKSLAQVVRVGYSISMETLLLRLCGLRRCHLHGNAAVAAVQAGDALAGHGVPTVGESWGAWGAPGCGVTEESWMHL